MWVWRLAALATLAGCARAQEPATGHEIDLSAPETERRRTAPPIGLCTEDPGACGVGPADGGRPPAATGTATTDTVWRVTVSGEDPQRGRPDALVTLVVFSDFECPFCKHMAAALDALLKEFPDLRVVWKDLPSSMHPNAERAALFARAVRAREGDAGFWAAHDALFAAQPALDDGTLQGIAKRLGLHFRDVQKDLAERLHARFVLDAAHLADRLEIDRVPTLFINGRKVVGAAAPAKLAELIRDELARAEAVVKGGTPRAALYSRLVERGRETKPVTDLPAE